MAHDRTDMTARIANTTMPTGPTSSSRPSSVDWSIADASSSAAPGPTSTGSSAVTCNRRAIGAASSKACPGSGRTPQPSGAAGSAQNGLHPYYDIVAGLCCGDPRPAARSCLGGRRRGLPHGRGGWPGAPPGAACRGASGGYAEACAPGLPRRPPGCARGCCRNSISRGTRLSTGCGSRSTRDSTS